jgi:hypothetical protein
MSHDTRLGFARTLDAMSETLLNCSGDKSDIRTRTELGRASRELYVIGCRLGLHREVEQFRLNARRAGLPWAERIDLGK